MKTALTVKRTATSLVALVAASSAVSAQDWEGFYGGISLNHNSGDVGDGSSSTSSDYDIDSDISAGLFLGHNWAIGDGNTYVGAEIAYSPGDIESSDYSVSELLDIKLRLGQSFGQIMVYGFVGISHAGDSNTGYDEDYGTKSGSNIGIGAAYKVNDRFSVGLELMQRNIDMEGYYDYGTAKINTISFRGALHF